MNIFSENLRLSSLEISKKIQIDWQEMVDLLVSILDVPSALIMRVNSHEVKLFIRSNNKENIYKLGQTDILGSGVYCEKVMSTQQELLVSNALKDPVWEVNPCVDLGMIAYLGLPLIWPTGESFGTICILDNKSNLFSGYARDLLHQFQKSVQHHLANTYYSDKGKHLNTKSEQALEAKYTSLIKSIPAATYTASLDKNSTTLFISEQIEAIL